MHICINSNGVFTLDIRARNATGPSRTQKATKQKKKNKWSASAQCPLELTLKRGNVVIRRQLVCL